MANNHLKPESYHNHNCNCNNSNNKSRGRRGNLLEQAKDEGVEPHAVVGELRELANLWEEAVEDTCGWTCMETKHTETQTHTDQPRAPRVSSGFVLPLFQVSKVLAASANSRYASVLCSLAAKLKRQRFDQFSLLAVFFLYKSTEINKINSESELQKKMHGLYKK